MESERRKVYVEVNVTHEIVGTKDNRKVQKLWLAYF